MIHPPPKEIAISHCPACARVSFNRHVNRLDEIPKRFCILCGGELEIVLYAVLRTLPKSP